MDFSDDTPDTWSSVRQYPKGPPRAFDVPSTGHPNWFVLEGIDGSGKTTVVNALKQFYRDKGFEVATVKLTGSDIVSHALERARWVNADPVSMTLLYWISLYDQVSTLSQQIDPGAIVLFDRYVDSVRARAQIEGVDPVLLDRLGRGLPKPAKTFVLDCDPLEAWKRLRGVRKVSYYEAGRHRFATSKRREHHFIVYQAMMRSRYLEFSADTKNAIAIDTRRGPNYVLATILEQLGFEKRPKQ